MQQIFFIQHPKICKGNLEIFKKKITIHVKSPFQKMNGDGMKKRIKEINLSVEISDTTNKE